ncbi:uncharacterized protein LOC114252282, partial [Bombyx mandarina]|uniref:Uncharacterized protein LOC114252282 n=1 Tax=Bombyx mandarina TaxID=7092 RepID=A0A6J2KNQ1_BOMMA
PHETVNSFTKTENINRLRRNLKGRAKEAVDGLLITNADPSDVIRSLEARFGRPETIAITELDTLRALPRLTERPRDICIFSSKVTNAVATLRALNCTHYLYNPETTKTMLEKLTPTLRYRYYDFTAVQPKEDPDLIKFEKFMKREAELCSPYAQPEQAGHYSQPAQYNRRTQNVHIVSEKPSRAKCPVCSNTEHTTTDCYIFKKADSNTRWDIAKNKHLCFRCLQYKNKTHNCKPNTCGINDCKYTHNKMLHFDRKIEKTDNSDKETIENINSAWTGKQKQSYLKIIPVQVQGPIGTVDTYALLDDGSTVTLIDEIICKKTGITGPIDPLHIQAINNIKSTETRSRRVNLTLRGLNSRKEIIQARTVNDLQVTAQKIPKEQIDEYSHLRDISDIITYENAKPGILIGQDNWHMLLASKVRRGNRNQPIASLTPLGWVLHGGRTRTLGHHINYINHASETQEDDKIENLVKQYFAMDALCITPRRPKTDPEEQALRILYSNTVHTTDGRYETALLWKTDNVSLPDNYNNSLKRLINIENKLDRNPELKQKYTEQMEALVAKGYAEPAPKTKTENRTWYLPHFAVLNPLKPEKLRVVHDTAARRRGVALNDMLLKGPDLLQSLPGVIMRFRQHNITVTADIKEMFIQVKLRPEDRDALRYLWCKDQRDDKPPEENRMTSLIFGASSSLATAIYLKNLNTQKQEATHPEAAVAVQNRHYVDDFYLDNLKTLKDAVHITTELSRKHERKPTSKTFWTDSKIVLRWTRTGSRSNKPYVAQRLTAIEDSSTINGRRWLPTKHNLADDVTRDVPMSYQNEHRWFRGTEFLRQREDSWPTESASETTEPMGEVNIAAAAPARASWLRRRHEKWKCLPQNTRTREKSDRDVSRSRQRGAHRRHNRRWSSTETGTKTSDPAHRRRPSCTEKNATDSHGGSKTQFSADHQDRNSSQQIIKTETVPSESSTKNHQQDRNSYQQFSNSTVIRKPPVNQLPVNQTVTCETSLQKPKPIERNSRLLPAHKQTAETSQRFS